MVKYTIRHAQESENGKCLSLHVQSEAMIYLADVQFEVHASRYDFIFVNYDVRNNVFNSIKTPLKYDKQDMLAAIHSVYPEIPKESWHAEKKFAVLRDPRDIMLMALSY